MGWFLGGLWWVFGGGGRFSGVHGLKITAKLIQFIHIKTVFNFREPTFQTGGFN